MKNAIIFDLDGTLVDSISFHFKLHQEVFKRFDIELTKQFFEVHCNGTEHKEFYKKILNHHHGTQELLEQALKEEKRLKKKIDIKAIRTYPGVKKLLKDMSKRNFQICVASSSHTSYVNEILKTNKIKDYFHIVVGSEHFKHSKPNPAIFLEARKKMNVAKKECIIIEDSINGVIAAKRAGIDVICLLTSERREDIPAYATIAQDHREILGLIEKM